MSTSEDNYEVYVSNYTNPTLLICLPIKDCDGNGFGLVLALGKGVNYGWQMDIAQS